MRLIADIGDGVPSFYVDDCGVFWMHSESEQYESTLQAIERSENEACYPTVDPDRSAQRVGAGSRRSRASAGRTSWGHRSTVGQRFTWTARARTGGYRGVRKLRRGR